MRGEQDAVSYSQLDVDSELIPGSHTKTKAKKREYFRAREIVILTITFLSFSDVHFIC